MFIYDYISRFLDRSNSSQCTTRLRSRNLAYVLMDTLGTLSTLGTIGALGTSGALGTTGAYSMLEAPYI